MYNKIISRFFADAAIIFNDYERMPKVAHALVISTAVLSLVPICGFIPVSVEIIFYLFLFVDILYLICGGGMKLNPQFLFLFAVIIVNVLVLNIPSFFKPVQRSILFIIVVTTVSSVLTSELAVRFRRRLFKYVILGLIALSVGSFFCFFLGVNMMSRRVAGMDDFDAYSSHGGWFGGLTVHSMMLGPISMVATLFFYVLYIEKRRWPYLALFFMTAMSAVFASSRAALLGIAVAVAYSLIFGKFSARMRRRMLGILLVCGLCTVPIYDTAFKGVINKNETRRSQTGSYNSRESKFSFRISEFKSSPLLGVGFCAIDINGGDAYNPFDGHVEPGSSHLSVLSMTGALGMAAYILILYDCFNRVRQKSSAHARFAMLCFIAIFMHAWFEGYIFSAGGFLAFLYWMIVGQCIDCKNVKNVQIRGN